MNSDGVKRRAVTSIARATNALVMHAWFPATVRRWLLRSAFINRVVLSCYRLFGRPVTYGETAKARQRRTREGFFTSYCSGKGLDIGYGGDLVCESARGWDAEHGDAQQLADVPDELYDYVYSSHTLEHMISPEEAVKNWWRVVRRGGYLILYIPHRDLYEKKTTLPSRWNTDHKHYFLLDRDEEPCTLGVLPLLARSINGYSIIYARECSEGNTLVDPLIQSTGEYSIEVVLKKREQTNSSL
jgi:SAM-dependent methyltransferase